MPPERTEAAGPPLGPFVTVHVRFAIGSRAAAPKSFPARMPRRAGGNAEFQDPCPALPQWPAPTGPRRCCELLDSAVTRVALGMVAPHHRAAVRKPDDVPISAPMTVYSLFSVACTHDRKQIPWVVSAPPSPRKDKI